MGRRFLYVPPSLYEKAREGHSVAWSKLADLAIRALTRLLLQYCAASLPTWEVEDLAHDAFTKTAIKFKAIATWPQAWRYMKVVALRSLRRRLAHWQKTVSLSEANPEPVDPASELPTLLATLNDLLDRLFPKLARRDARALFSIIDGVVLRKLSLHKTAAEMKVSFQTLKRHRRKIRASCAHWYAQQE